MVWARDDICTRARLRETVSEETTSKQFYRADVGTGASTERRGIECVSRQC